MRKFIFIIFLFLVPSILSGADRFVSQHQFNAETSGVFNVKYYGAVGDGSTNDAAAIQAAIDAASAAGGGTVFFPVATYKVTGSGDILTLKTNVRLKGILGGGTTWTGSVIDARTITTANSNIVNLEDTFRDVAIEGLSFRGAGSSSVPNSNLGAGGVVGIYVGQQGTGAFLKDLRLEGFSENVVVRFSGSVFMDNVAAVLARNTGIAIYGSTNITLYNCGLSNSGLSSRATDGNLYIAQGGEGTRSRAITLIAPLVDEGGQASINIQGADDILLLIGTLYFASINSNGTGNGYGIKLGDGTNNPTGVTIVGAVIKPFNPAYTATATILLQGSGHHLIGIKTDANGGTDIVDLATGTTYDAVNGSSKTPGTLQTGKSVVASLPTCNSAAEGSLYAVTDGLAPTFLATIVGGGAIHAPVYCNGTNWVAH